MFFGSRSDYSALGRVLYIILDKMQESDMSFAFLVMHRYSFPRHQ